MGAMEVTDLTHDERFALVALLELVVESVLGAEEYDRLADEANQRFTDEDALKAFVLCVRRQDARELIYGQVLEAAVENGVDKLEAELLDWLAKTWGVRVQILDEPTND
jgi:hypothetical protein